MKRNAIIRYGIIVCLFLLSGTVFADNPIVQTNYTADPAPMVHNDTFWVYSGHDEDGATVWFNMREWRCYSSVDMANWTDHGSPLDLSAFSSWANADAWAAHCIPHNDKFYFAVPVFHTGTKDRMIGIAVADQPTGPFRDAVGEPLLSRNDCCYIDPALFRDDDGQMYMYWGNPYCFYVKMNDDMTSYSGDVVQIPENRETFSNCYGEGPWIYKRNDLYYMIWAADNANGKENIRYSTAPSVTGPWSYAGIVMEQEGLTRAEPCTSWTNHPGLVDYKGKSYFVYHNAGLPGGSGFQRSACIEEFEFNEDGSIPQIHMTLEGPEQIGHLNPYDTTQAETICWSEGVKTESCSEGGMNVCQIENGDYIKVKGVDFGESGATKFEARVASAGSGGSIELYLDTLTGPKIGTCEIQGTGDWQTWRTMECAVTDAKGVHDLYFKFTGGNGSLFNFNWWVFTPVPVGIGSQGQAVPSTNSNMITVRFRGTNNHADGISFPVPSAHGTIRIHLFDLNGRRAATLYEGRISSLTTTIFLTTAGIWPGVYLSGVTIANGSVVYGNRMISF